MQRTKTSLHALNSRPTWVFSAFFKIAPTTISCKNTSLPCRLIDAMREATPCYLSPKSVGPLLLHQSRAWLVFEAIHGKAICEICILRWRTWLNQRRRRSTSWVPNVEMGDAQWKKAQFYGFYKLSYYLNLLLILS